MPRAHAGSGADSSSSVTGTEHSDSTVVIDDDLGRGKRNKVPNTRYSALVRWSHFNTAIVPTSSPPTSNPVSGTPFPLTHCQL